jgi:hypothetical protein
MKSTTNARTQRQHSGPKPEKVENKQAGPRVKTGLKAGVMKSRHDTIKNTISN